MPVQERPGLFGRIRNFFQRQPQANQQQNNGQHQGNPYMNPNMRMNQQQRMPSGEPPLAEVSADAQGQQVRIQAANASKAGPAPANPVNPKLVNKIGHEDDYSWVTGQLFQENGQWLVRYATPDTVDRFNGAFLLGLQGTMQGVRPGDLVSVRGTVVPNPRGGVAVYRVTSVDLIERSGQ